MQVFLIALLIVVVLFVVGVSASQPDHRSRPETRY
jgi:hypothetical protein